MSRIRPVILAVTLTLVFSPALALAQATSSLLGNVIDPSGALLPGATIELKNTATRATMKTTSNGVGAYTFPQVPPGLYRIRATAGGFVAVDIAGIELLVNQPASIDIIFTKLGVVTETLFISADTDQVNTVDASQGNAVGTRTILQLPLEARNVVTLLSLQSGVAFTRDTEPVTFDEGEFDTRHGSANGGRSDQANVTLDGVDVNDQSKGTAFTSALRVTLDSVQEFRTTTLNAGADQGRSSGAQVALVTKSGTNEYHGSAYWYHRNTATTANDFFLNQQGKRKPILKRNIFGGSIGGPVKANRLFFFFNYEGRTDRSEESVVRTVPSETLRVGIFRYIKQDGSVGVLNPRDIANTIDPLGIGPNPNVLKYFSKFPSPNDDTEGDGLNLRGYRFVAPTPLNWNTYIARWDWYVDKAAKHQLFFRGNYQDDDRSTLPQFDGGPPRFRVLNNSKGLAIGYNVAINPTLFCTSRYGFTRESLNRAGASTETLVDFLPIDDLDPATRSLITILPVHTFSEDVSWVKGSHQLKSGGVVRLISNQRTNFERSFHSPVINSSWLLGSGALAPPDTAEFFERNAIDAMGALLGLLADVTARYNYRLDGSVQPVGSPVIRNFQQQNYELYFMDTWRITRELTLTAGLRWHLHPPVEEANGYQTSPVPNLEEWFNKRGSLAAQGRSQTEAGSISYVLRHDPQGRPLYPFHKRDFEPRVALAYSPQISDGILGKLFGGPHKTSIRVGFGMFHDNFGQSVIRLYDTAALGLSTALQTPSNAFNSETAPRFTSLTEIPPETLQPAPPGGFPQEAPEAFSITHSVDGNLKAPYSVEVSLSIGRTLPRKVLVEASYVGRLSRRSLAQRDLAMPTNLRDPKSGQTWWEAVNQLVDMRDAGVPVTTTQTIPWFENMMPAVAGYFPDGGSTATQNMLYYMYNIFEPQISYGGPYDYISVQADIDQGYVLPANRLGRNSMFSPQYSALAAWSSIGHGDYHAAQLTMRKRFGDGFQFDLNYTFSKSLDLASAAERTIEFTDLLVNSWNPWQLWSYSDYDLRHQVNANWVVELPFGRNKKWGRNWNRVVDGFLGGWQVAGLWRMTSGLPGSIGNGGTWPTNYNHPGFATQVGPTPQMGVFKNAVAPDGTSGPNVFADPVTAVQSWGKSRAGESGQRNGIRGDGYFTLDLGLGKRVFLPRDGHSIQLRWETFNVTNTPSFDIGAEYFSLGQGASFGKYSYLLTNARVMQFALRYEF